MDKSKRDIILRSLTPTVAVLEAYDELSFRVQAIENILIGERLTSKRKLRRSVETIRKTIEAERASVVVAFLKEIQAETKNRRIKKLFDKPSGPLQ